MFIIALSLYHSIMRKLLLLFIALLSLTACLKDDDYSTSATDHLTFSTDTVAFDTIISGIPTNTYTFTVYNHNDKAIRIPRVYLEGTNASHFQVNVDGMPLADGAGTDFEIGAKDSLMVFLFAKVPDADTDEPVHEEGSLVFQTESGNTHKVVLTASGQSVISLNAKEIKADTTLSAQRPYRVMDSLVVHEGATLTLAEGTRFYFHAGAKLIVHGTLRVLGSLQHPVEMRGDRLGNMFAGQPYDRIPGQWGGVVLAKESYGNYITYADIHSGNFGIQVDSSDVETEKLYMDNSILHNTKGDGLSSRMANIYVGNCQITNSGGNCVKVRGGSATFVHCTIARFYVFTGGSGVALDFANYDGSVRLPLKSIQFANCLITGYQSDEVMGSQNTKYKNDAYEYAFFNCLFNTTHPESEDKRLVNCLWDDADGSESVKREKNFTPDFNTDALTFSFQLSGKSQAIANADSTISVMTYPYDLLGRPRTGNGIIPDIGCYQHVTN